MGVPWWLTWPRGGWGRGGIPAADLLVPSSPGVYVCAQCGYELFSSRAKYEHSSPWPAFTETIHEDSVAKRKERPGALKVMTVKQPPQNPKSSFLNIIYLFFFFHMFSEPCLYIARCPVASVAMGWATSSSMMAPSGGSPGSEYSAARSNSSLKVRDGVWWLPPSLPLFWGEPLKPGRAVRGCAAPSPKQIPNVSTWPGSMGTLLS